MRIAGAVLAAGAGSRYGRPKALVRTLEGEPWIARAVAALRDGGADDAVFVALGAERERAAPLVPAGAVRLDVAAWRAGVSETLRAVLAAASDTPADALVIVPVDTPGMPPSTCRRIIAHADTAADRLAALVRATYGGRPGHPVLLGRAHWEGAAASVSGDRGAGAYLAEHGAQRIECGDLWDGRDIDAPA